jgi:hypothetical protein
MHAESATARLPLSGVLMIADAFDHFPAVTSVRAPEKRGRLDAAPQVLLVAAGLE